MATILYCFRKFYNSIQVIEKFKIMEIYQIENVIQFNLLSWN